MISLAGIKKFKIRASSASKICAGTIGCTEKQLSTIAEYEIKKKGKGITDKQEVELQRLLKKQSNPELPKGAKTYCQQWLKEQAQMYNVTKEFTSKFTAKGDTVEDKALRLIGKYLGIEVKKNDQYFDNEWCEGTPDALPEIVIDNKSSWDPFSFPLFETKLDNGYWWQGQTYMDLTGMKEAKFIYTLVDTPEELVRKEARDWCFKNGCELNPDIVEEFRQRMTFDHLPMELRVKEFYFERDELAIGKLHERVELCRAYIDKLIADIEAGRPVEDLSGLPDEE